LKICQECILGAGKTYVDKAKEIIADGSSNAIFTNLTSKFAVLHSRGLSLDKIMADPEFEALRKAAGLGKEYVNNMYNAAGHTLDLPEEEIIAYYAKKIGSIGQEVRAAKTYLTAPSSYISRARQAGASATGFQKAAVGMVDKVKSMPGKIKVSSTFRSVTSVRLKTSTGWGTVTKGFIKVAGQWKQWYNIPLRDTFTRTTSGNLGTSESFFSWSSLFGTWFANGSQAQY